ncbi:response regulator [Rhizobium halophytocola]|uniref:DNA-binding response OmpR family regulator n=1 Tax=Rhizobium halophytocola TaxID=735519 RepID=A0ABS4DV16_9HYPH|nr:response regulator transcription factor [Rhizobium halophytocola]MBP1849469.1 DNA-binding response OmpR family regulator [Rhizobium halophytocola]
MENTGAMIVIVEDDAEIRGLVSDLLGREGYGVRAVDNAAALDACLNDITPDLLILDLMLPGEDGLSICRRMRATSNLPILMLTAKGDEIDRVVGLEMGADDYLVKPFGPRELLARVRALLRRAEASTVQPVKAARRYAFDRFVVDLDSRQLTDKEGIALSLTSAEFDMLACFVTRPRRVLSRDQILDWIHGRSSEPFDRTVDVLISRLRKKLDSASPGTPLISTVRNGGYLFTATVQQQAG